MSEKDSDHEQLVDALEPVIATELIGQEILPRSVNEGNNLTGRGKYTIKLLKWLGRLVSFITRRSGIVLPVRRLKSHLPPSLVHRVAYGQPCLLTHIFTSLDVGPLCHLEGGICR